jgi:hypothetical protein
LHDINYFKNFKISLNTIVWENEAGFAPEFLTGVGTKTGRKASLVQFKSNIVFPFLQ